MTQTECSACGTKLAAYQMRCPACGKTTAQYHRQRRCLHCGAPAAEQAKSCFMCHKPVDSLPLDSSIFSGSWRGIGLGVLIIVGIVVLVTRYQISSDEAAAALNIENTPTLTATPAATSTRTPTHTPTPTVTPTVTPLPSPTLRSHEIESGETLLFLAGLYDVTVEELARLNSINETTILHVGQLLKIPASADLSAIEQVLPPQIIYTVQSGDTLSSIAYTHGTTVDGIMASNPDQDLALIFPGQELVVPLSTPTPTGTATPLPTETATPQPDYAAPNLLSPADEQMVDASTLLLSWTSTALLAEDEFYVLEINWLNGETTEHWLKSTSLRIAKEERPANGLATWRVTIKRQTGTSPQGTPSGVVLTAPGELRTFEWR
jgi:LysM repeat protein